MSLNPCTHLTGPDLLFRILLGSTWLENKNSACKEKIGGGKIKILKPIGLEALHWKTLLHVRSDSTVLFGNICLLTLQKLYFGMFRIEKHSFETRSVCFLP